MTGLPWRGAAWAAAAGVLVAVGLVGASALLVPDPPRRMALPAAGDLVALERYLDPADTTMPELAGVPEPVRVAGTPFGGRFSGTGTGTGTSTSTGTADRVAGTGRGTGTGTGDEDGARLSAVLVAGERRVAIVDDRMVRAGDRLEDGSRVASIGRDHIVIILPDGGRRRLNLDG